MTSSTFGLSSLWVRPESPIGWTVRDRGASPPPSQLQWSPTSKAEFNPRPSGYTSQAEFNPRPSPYTSGVSPRVSALSPSTSASLVPGGASPIKPALDVTHERHLIPAPTRDVSGVVQALERELSQERFERREQVAFLTKMHEREAALLKSRADMAEQKLEEERRLFEKEKAVLVSRARYGDEEEQATSSKLRTLEVETGRKSEAMIELQMQLRQTEEHLWAGNTQIDHFQKQISQLRTEEQVEKDASIRQDVQLRSAQNENFRLENEIESQRRQRESLEDQLRRTERETEVSFNQTQQLHEQEQQRLMQEGTRWRDISQDVSKKAVDLEGRFEVMRRDCLAVREELRNSESRCGDVSSMLQTVERERDEWIRKHRSAHESLERVQLEMHQEKVTRTQIEHSSDDKLSTAGRQLQELDSSLKEMRWRFDKLEQSSALEVIKYRTEIEDFQKVLVKESATKSEQEQLIGELKSVQNSTEQERQSLITKVRMLEDKLQQDHTSKVKVEGTLEAMKRERDQVQAMVESFRGQVQTLEHKSSTYERERDSALHLESEEKKKYHDYEARMRQWQREEERRLHSERMRCDSLVQQAQSEMTRSEQVKVELEKTLESLQDETRNLATALHLQHQKAVSLDGTMRKHLHILDHRIQDLHEETRSGIAGPALISSGFPSIKPRSPSPVRISGLALPADSTSSPSKMGFKRYDPESKSPISTDPLFRSIPSLTSHLGAPSLGNPMPANPMPGPPGSLLSPRPPSPKLSARGYGALSPSNGASVGAGPAVPEGPLSPKTMGVRSSPSAGGVF